MSLSEARHEKREDRESEQQRVRKANNHIKAAVLLTYFKTCINFKVFSNTFTLIHFNTVVYFLFTEATDEEKQIIGEFGLKHIFINQTSWSTRGHLWSHNFITDSSLLS